MMSQKRAIQQQALSLWTGHAIYHGIEYVPRTGINLWRYKRRLRRMVPPVYAPVCPPDRTWEVVLLGVAVIGAFIYATLKWWFLW